MKYGRKNSINTAEHAPFMKRMMSLLLAACLLFGLFSCRKEETPSSSFHAVSSAPVSSPPVSSAVPSPEPHGYPAEGSFFLDYGEHSEDDPKGARLDLKQKDGHTGILFTILYDTYEWTFRQYTVKSPEEKDGIVLIEFTGENEHFSLSCMYDHVDVEYYWDGALDPVSGCYVRGEIQPSGYELPPIPEPVYDPNTPEGKIDKAIAAAARDALMRPKDSMLTEEDCAMVLSIDISEERLISLGGIEYFTNLKSIYIGSSYLKDFSPLAALPHIESISINWSYLETIPDLSGCKELSRMELVCNQISDLSPLSSIRGLSFLNLSDNNVTSISPLKNMTSLETLILKGNPILDWECISENGKLIEALDCDYELTLKTMEKAREIISGIIDDDMDDLEKELAIYTKIHEIADYKEVHRPQRPYGYQVIMEGTGVCGDYSEAVSLLMNLAGLRCISVYSDTHAWNMIEIYGKWYELDCLWDDNIEPVFWQYLNVGREFLKSDTDHSCDPWRYPFADSSMPKLDYLMLFPPEVIYGE
ncbi:MAG: leucine-rich repeat domain-containing protein [Clostridia bacterium]|nr:leucine-rich repeat domain-containing protein [Clostridia bacterium]